MTGPVAVPKLEDVEPIDLGHGLAAAIMEITPDVASFLLTLNDPENRNISRERVEGYALAMAEGRWYLNGESLVIDEHMVMRSGQHRCLASVRSECSFKTLVVFGISTDAVASLDTGKARSAADVLQMNGYKNTHLLAAMARVVLQTEARDLGKSFDNMTVRKVLARHPSLAESGQTIYRPITSAFKGHGVSNRVVGGLMYLFSLVDPDRQQDFQDRLCQGYGLEKGDPILALRNSFLSSTNTKRLSTTAQYVYTIKAWNAYMEGRSVLILRRGESEALPEVYGLTPKMLQGQEFRNGAR
jgi:hypothetical protein